MPVPNPVRSFPPLLLAGLCFFKAGAASAENLEVAGRALAIAPPAGYCAIDRGNAAEHDLQEMIEQVNRGLNRVLLVFVDCTELQSWRRGETKTFNRHGQILTPAVETALEQVGRAAFLERLGGVMDRAFAGGLDDGRSRAVAVLPELSLGEVRSLGVLGHDEAALYAGMAELLVQDGREVVMAGVVAISLLNRVPVSVNLYRPYRDPASIEALLEEQKRLMRDLLQRNDPLDSQRVLRGATDKEPG